MTRAAIIPAILDACPSFAGPWQAYLDRWQGESDSHLAALEVALHFIDLQQRGNHAERVAGLGAVEDLMRRADRDARAILVVDLVYYLQEASSYRQGSTSALLPLLGRETGAAWDRLAPWTER